MEGLDDGSYRISHRAVTHLDIYVVVLYHSDNNACELRKAQRKDIVLFHFDNDLVYLHDRQI